MDSDDEQTFQYAMQLTSSTALPMTLKATTELGVLEIIANAAKAGKQLSADDVAAQIPTKNSPTLDRMLRLLASYSVLSCDVEVDGNGCMQRKYGAAPVLKYLTRDEDGLSVAGMGLLQLDKVCMESWYYLNNSLLSEEVPFEKAHGEPIFSYMGKDSRFNKIFNEAMSNVTVIFMKKILERYTYFNQAKVVVDVGGGIGLNLSMIVAKHPHIKGINFDLPHVISEAPTLIGVEQIGGDMFENVPTGDTILMKWVLHDWSDEHCIKILKNCWKALPDDGVVILMEYIASVFPETTLAAQSVFNIDLHMLAVCQGGKERTQDEFKCLAKKAGFTRFEALFGYSGIWLMKLSK